MKTSTTNINYIEFNSISTVLTINNVKSILGKIVNWTHPTSSDNDQYVYRSQFAEVISEFDLAARFPEEKYPTRQARWIAELSEARLEEFKNTLIILDSDGKDTGIRLYPGEECFSCSDEGRYVSFVVEDVETTEEQTRLEVGRCIRQLREVKSLTLKDLADRTGVAFNRIAEIEKGRYSAGVDVLTRILSGLDAHIEVVSDNTDMKKWSSSPIRTLQNLADYLNDSEEWPLDVDAEFIEARGWEDLTGSEFDVCRNEKELLTMQEDGRFVVVSR